MVTVVITDNLFLLHSQVDSDGDTEEMVVTLTCSDMYHGLAAMVTVGVVTIV